MSEPDAPRAHIGVFDSGIGGLSVLRALLAIGPTPHLHYLADAANAPYGDRTQSEITALSQSAAATLIEAGARLVVVACNTATASAIESLRRRWPDIDFVGIEPAIKPAAAATRNGRIGVLATPATLASERLRRLVERHAGDVSVFLQPCPGLASAIERHAEDEPALLDMVARYAAPLVDADVDTVVLGCTHYPLLRGAWQAAFGPAVTLLDPAEAVAARVRSLWGGDVMPQRSVRLSSTGDRTALSRVAARWLGLPEAVEATPLATIAGARDRDRTGTPPVEGGGV